MRRLPQESQESKVEGTPGQVPPDAGGQRSFQQRTPTFVGRQIHFFVNSYPCFLSTAFICELTTRMGPR